MKTLKGRDGPEAEAPEQWLLERARLYAILRPEAKYRPHLERWLRDAGFDFDEDAERAAARSSSDRKLDWRAERREREYGSGTNKPLKVKVISGRTSSESGGNDG